MFTRCPRPPRFRFRVRRRRTSPDHKVDAPKDTGVTQHRTGVHVQTGPRALGDNGPLLPSCSHTQGLDVSKAEIARARCRASAEVPNAEPAPERGPRACLEEGVTRAPRCEAPALVPHGSGEQQDDGSGGAACRQRQPHPLGHPPSALPSACPPPRSPNHSRMHRRWPPWPPTPQNHTRPRAGSWHTVQRVRSARCAGWCSSESDSSTVGRLWAEVDTERAPRVLLVSTPPKYHAPRKLSSLEHTRSLPSRDVLGTRRPTLAPYLATSARGTNAP